LSAALFALAASRSASVAEFRAAAALQLDAQAAIEARDAKNGAGFEQYLAEYAAG